MTDIMKLAQEYAVRYRVNQAVDEARSALQSAIEALQAECASLKQIAELNAQIAIDLKEERDQLQVKLDGLQKQQPVAYRAWFDADNGARWLFTLWPEEERLDVEWEPLYAAPKALAPLKWAPEEIADGMRGIRWVLPEGVFGRPTDCDVREYLQRTGTARGCQCEKCKTFYGIGGAP